MTASLCCIGFTVIGQGYHLWRLDWLVDLNSSSFPCWLSWLELLQEPKLDKEQRKLCLCSTERRERISSWRDKRFQGWEAITGTTELYRYIKYILNHYILGLVYNLVTQQMLLIEVTYKCAFNMQRKHNIQQVTTEARRILRQSKLSQTWIMLIRKSI